MTVTWFHLKHLISGFSMEINPEILHITREVCQNYLGNRELQYTTLLSSENRHDIGFGISRFDQGGFLCEGIREVSYSITWTLVKERGEKPVCVVDLRKLFRKSSHQGWIYTRPSTS